MNKSCAALSALLLASSPAMTASAEVEANLPAPAPVDELETILVTGEQPGPGLWKVSRDDHVMWVLGSIGTVPGTFVWQTKNVQARIAESQDVLHPGGANVGVDIGVFKALTLVPLAFKAAKNPDGATLEDVLTPESYAQWRKLKLAYIGDDDDIERSRPVFAEEKLHTALTKKFQAGTALMNIDGVVSYFARKQGVKIITSPTANREFEIKNLRAILKAARKMDFAESECVGRNLDRLDQSIKEDRVLFDKRIVNAWATGDLETLRAMPTVDSGREDCIMVAMNAVTNRPVAELPEGMSQGVDILKKMEELNAQVVEEAERNWLDAAEAALARNQSTFAVLPIDVALSSTGYLAKLQARGYVVEEPR